MSRDEHRAEIDVHVHHTTEKAYLVSTDGDEEAAVWIPMSQVEDITPEYKKPGAYTLDIPQWLAEKEDLV
jgi:hypothetical protein